MRFGARACAVAALLLLFACTPDRGPNPAPSATPRPVTLAVMEFNVEYGGEEVDFSGVPKAIEAGGADLVAIEEGYGNMPRIARAVGWPYYDPRTQILSRYPLLTPPHDPPFVYVEVAPGRVVAIANVHLPSTSYGPFQVRDGASAAEVVAIERRKRLPVIEPVLGALERLAAQGVPVFLTGDFNAPSHLDWTSETVGARDQVRFPVSWPVSMAVEGAGLVDSFRAAHPDPVTDPGVTWPADRPFVPGYNPASRGAPADRIDFVYAGGPAEVTDSVIVGETGGAGVDVPVEPWPTDHRATVSTFQIRPAPEPTIVSVDRRLVAVGDELPIRFHAPADASLAVVPGLGGSARTSALVRIPAGPGSEATPSTTGWDPGPYEVVLLASSGEELSRSAFWLEGPGSRPVLGTDRRVYPPGAPIRVGWSDAPGNRFDWIGVYRRGADPNVASYLLWAYTGATVSGSLVLDRDASGSWPLRPGRYAVYLLRDDSYVKIGAVVFTVR